jgi:8-oxo-dGTP pyrophosphatase MutT (NUDIX family)
MNAAGIMFLAPGKRALFLRRSNDSKAMPGYWDFPGGGQEGAETAEETALREAREEVGQVPEGKIKELTHTPGSALKGVAGPGAPAVPPVPAGAPVDLPQSEPPGGVDYTTFMQKVGNEFIPELSPEHDGWSWSPVDHPPEPLHPGCRVALERLGMNELDIARAIAEGRLASPQKYENVWLFAIRITGTGAAYRDKLDEFVIRDRESHTSGDALARLNGLPVIFKHPRKSLLDAEEFGNRVVGTVFLPYVAGDEVWAVAKIFIDDVARMMSEGGLSTSPGVNFADFSVNAKLTLEDGSKVLVEGEPSLFDHVAICELGVWDKGEGPTGIRAESREDSMMADEDKRDDGKKRDDSDHRTDKKRDDATAIHTKKDGELEIRHEGGEVETDKKRDDGKKRDDADAGHNLDHELSHTLIDSMKALTDAVAGLGRRMDAIEDIEKKRDDAKRDDSRKRDDKKRDDAKRDDDDEEDKERDDAKRKDDDEEGEEPKELAAKDKAKKDSKRDDAKRDDKKRDDSRSDSAMRDRLDRIEADAREIRRAIPKDMDDDDYAAMADAQARADDVFSDFGRRAPRPLQGETPSMYERRCVRMLQDHSATWKGKNITSAFTDEAAFGIIRDQVYKEARADAANPVDIPAGQLRMVEKRRDGHIIREFYGQPRDWMSPIAGPVQLRGEGTWKTGGLGGNNNH